MLQGEEKLRVLFFELLGELSIKEITTNSKLMLLGEKIVRLFSI